jgi:hypothetical protein
MKIRDILYLIFTALILSYPLYEKYLIKDIYRSNALYYIYVPLAVICFVLMLWITISGNIESSSLTHRIKNQEINTRTLFAENLLISSLEIRTRYKFEYQNDLKATIKMEKANPIKMYFVNTDIEKDSLAFVCDNPKIYFPNKNTIEFKFVFFPDDIAALSRKPMNFLEKYNKIYFPWKSFTHYLALLKLGGPIKQSTDPKLFFQIIINGKVLIEQDEVIKNIDPDSVILIFNTEPELFKDIEKRYLDL